MNNKEEFIKVITEAIELGTLQLSPSAAEYFEELQNDKKNKPILTDKGIQILSFMQQNEEKYNNIFKSKDIGEGIFLSSRQVSGAIQKLIKEGFCAKLGGNPVCYQITEIGREKDLDEVSIT